jgi:enoyl-CoA hydratase
MDFKEIVVDKKNKITWITLNRPSKMNALTQLMLAELAAALDSTSKDTECAVVIVKGEGKAWSAGVDLAVFQEIKIEKGFKMHEDGIKVIELLATMPQASIAMLNGHCFTGAMELMLGFDMVFAADSAQIGDTHAKWGIPPKWGMTPRLCHQVGLKKAKELSFTAEAISGKEAERIGLVNQSVPLEYLQELVERKAALIVGNSSQVIAAEKQLYHFHSSHTLEEGLQFEQDFEMNLTDKTDTLKDFKNKLHS